MLELSRTCRREVIALSLCLAVSTPGCSTTESSPPPETTAPGTLGELVYRVLEDDLRGAEACPDEYVAALERRHTDFVATFDYTVTHGVVNDRPELLGGTLQPSVASGDLPELADALAEALALLVSDEFDPEREVLASVADLTHARSSLESSMAIGLVRRVLSDPAIPDKIHALALLTEANDGVDYVPDEVFEMLSRNLGEASEPSQCVGRVEAGVEDTLLRMSGFHAIADAGDPAYVARLGADGNPRVVVDPVRGLLPLPFADADRDSRPDLNEDGEPIDADGEVIDLPTIGFGEGYDASGRALNAHGGPLYDYYDAKRTALAQSLRIARDALAAGVHHDLAGVVDAALDEPVACDDGTETCYGYPSDPNVLADLVDALFELAKAEPSLTLADTLRAMVDDDPAQADRLFGQLGRSMQSVYATDLSIVDLDLIQTSIDLSTLLEPIFELPNGTSQSTPRVLVDMLHEAHQSAAQLPEQLGYLIDYRLLEKSPDCSAKLPSFDESIPVEFDKPRYYSAFFENRSGLEEFVEAVDVLDCGDFTDYGGGSLAHIFLNTLADQELPTVCFAVDDFLQAIGYTGELEEGDVSGYVLIASHGACDGAAVYAALASLDVQAKSGGFDAMIPLAKAFEAHGQTDLLTGVMGVVSDDLKLDEDADPTSHSVVRRLEPTLSKLIHGGAAEGFLDALDVATTVPASDGDGTLAEVIADFVDGAVQTGTVPTRAGPSEDTSLARRVLTSLHGLVTRVDDADRMAELQGLVGFFARTLTETRLVEGQPELANPNLRPLLGVLFDVALGAGELSHEQHRCYLSDLQAGAERFVLGRDFATIIRWVDLLETATWGPTIDDWLVDALTPMPDEPDLELYGPLLQMAAAGLATDFDLTDLGRVFHWLAGVSELRHGDERGMVVIVDDLLASDEDHAMLEIGRNLVAAGPLTSQEPPITTMMDIFDDVVAVDGAAMCTSTRSELDEQDLDDVVTSVLGFMQDDVGGLGAVWELVDEPAAVDEE